MVLRPRIAGDFAPAGLSRWSSTGRGRLSDPQRHRRDPYRARNQNFKDAAAALRRGHIHSRLLYDHLDARRFDPLVRETLRLARRAQQAIGQFIDHYNHHRCHESIGNVTPADTYFGRAPQILEERRKIKEKTLKLRRLHNQAQAA